MKKQTKSKDKEVKRKWRKAWRVAFLKSPLMLQPTSSRMATSRTTFKPNQASLLSTMPRVKIQMNVPTWKLSLMNLKTTISWETSTRSLLLWTAMPKMDLTQLWWCRTRTLLISGNVPLSSLVPRLHHQSKLLRIWNAWLPWLPCLLTRSHQSKCIPQRLITAWMLLLILVHVLWMSLS